jgi:hypothetical protein
MKKKEMKM